jgi:vacuolar-type H+-ATPase subunit E/Vma4
VGLHEVKTAIREKTKLEVAGQLQKAQAEAERIISEAKEQIKLKRAENTAKTQELLEALERKEHAAAQFARKSILLEEKRKAIDAVFTSVQQTLVTQDSATRSKLLAQLAEKASKAITVASVRCNSKDTAALKKIFSGATVTADESIAGGFTADDASGTVRVDYTYESLLAAVREQHMAELTRILFEQ